MSGSEGAEHLESYMSKAYSTRFGRIDQRIIDATGFLFDARPSSNGDLAACQRWLAEVSAVYRIPTPGLAVVPPGQCAGSGCYLPATNQILLPKVSVLTLLHEFRHAVQHHRPDLRFLQTGPADGPWFEHDARGWSMSLFRTCQPRLFDRLARQNRIFYVTAGDLTGAL
jgi:hypothetical protein